MSTPKSDPEPPLAKATFAGGCFWCLQHDFDDLKGVLSTTVGYLGGTITNPTYELVCIGTTGHFEAVEVLYDPSQISYEELLEFYWHRIDPTKSDGQFCDIGTQYCPAIFYHNDEQKRLAEKSYQEKSDSRKFPQVAVQIRPAQRFYPAEPYHQKYYIKSPFKYHWYRVGSGRDDRLKKLWGNP